MTRSSKRKQGKTSKLKQRSAKSETAPEHKRRFNQLLDDAIFGVKKK